MTDPYGEPEGSGWWIIPMLIVGILFWAWLIGSVLR
jgi:hypothetical protein